MMWRIIRVFESRPARPHSSRLILASLLGMPLLLSAAATPARAHADAIAYLIAVTVRPGYGFADANAAIDYGNSVCNKVSTGESYAELIANVESDFNTGDEFQASYLIDKAVNELCPAQIWQLRNSAAHYRPPAS